MSSSSTYTITPSLVDNPRQHLEAWTESVETHARSMCAMHDVTGALTLVMSDAKWNLMPVNLTNPVDVAAGQQPVYRRRPAYPEPAAHANNATSAAVNIHRMATTKQTDFTSPAAPSPLLFLQALAPPTRAFFGPLFRTSRRTCSLRARSWKPWQTSTA